MRIGVFGAGYVGLVTGTCFAEMGNEVVVCDIDAQRVARLRAGDVPIYEPGLEELVRRNLLERRLHFTTETGEAVAHGEVLFIAVGTPSGSDGSADLSSVLDVAREIGRHSDGPRIVVNKSTVPVGTAEKVRGVLAEVSDQEFHVVSNPEFLKEGAAIDDFMKPDRVIIGVEDGVSREVMEALYAPFVRTGKPILFMDTRSAEMSKYAANAMLAARITFMNEIANLCDRVGADVDNVRIALGADQRIGPAFLFPGVGFGGSCFPKDVRALSRLAVEVGYDHQLIKAIDSVNERQKRILLERIHGRFGADLSGRRFAVWGLAFKPQTDDVREAPSLVLIEGLLAAGAAVSAFDPVAVGNTLRIFGDRIDYAESTYAALAGADALVIVTEWNEFRFPDFQRMRSLLKAPVVFDGRNIYDPEKMAEMGFVYTSIGRPAIERAAISASVPLD